MPLITLDEAIEKIRNTPGSETSVIQNYFDQDIVAAAERFSQSNEFQEVRKLLSPHALPSKLLDLGAGRGIASYAFAKQGFEVTALDPDPSLVVGLGVIRELVRHTQLPIEIIESVGEDIPLPDSSFDIVYVRQVLHHASNLPLLMQEVFRVLKPGGIFLATREHVISTKEDLAVFLNNHLLHGLVGGENAFLLEQYTSAILSAGFKLEKLWGSHDSMINYYPRTLKDLKWECSLLFKPYIPARLTRLLLGNQPFFDYCKRRYSQRNQNPGRMYTFLATKSF